MTSKLTSLFIAISFLFLAACKPATVAPTATTDPALLRTAAAETASAYLTATAQAVPSQTPSPTPDLLQTAAIQTQAALQTQAAAATATPTAAATQTVNPSLIDRAAFVQDVTVPDGTNFKPGETFTKTWRLQNNGASTWNASYALVFISGDKMGGPDRVNLAANVAPGSQVDVSVNLVAPSQPGRYRGYWKMLNPANKFFDDAVYVEINVVSGATATPGGAVTPTSIAATATTGSVTISALSMSVDPQSFSGACPYTFNFTARFTLSASAAVSYQLEAGSNTPGFTFNLPPPVVGEQRLAGEQVLPFSLSFTNSVNGWVRLHITAPSDVASNQANFTLTCNP